MSGLESISGKIAALLLVNDGEITLADIEALPFVEDRELAEIIARELIQVFDAEIYPRKKREAGLSFWEEVIRLRKSPIAAPPNREPAT